MLINIYLHSDKESNRETGEEYGLSGEALRSFAYAGDEVRLTLEVDPETGDYKIIAVDGRKVED
jgi:hypothetical protein